MIVYAKISYESFVADLTVEELDIFQRVLSKFKDCSIDYVQNNFEITYEENRSPNIEIRIYYNAKFKVQSEV